MDKDLQEQLFENEPIEKINHDWAGIGGCDINSETNAIKQRTNELILDFPEYPTIYQAIKNRQSILILEPESKLCLPLAQKISHDFAGELDCAIAIWKGSGKKFFETIADQLDISTESEPDENGKTKALTMDGLKEAIADGINPEQTLLLFPEAKRLTIGVRYWLEDLIDAGLTVVAMAITNPRKDVFLQLTEIEIDSPTEVKIREIMRSEAERYGLTLSSAEISALLPQAGRSAIVAKQVIRRRVLGIENETAQHTQYINVTPLWFAFLAGFGAMKFIGMGTGRKDWQIFGGLAFMLFMSLKQLGQIRGTKRRIGQ